MPELECVASCSFDCNVYIWSTSCERLGSLVLGTDKHWGIHIDKGDRNEMDRVEAVDTMDRVAEMDYEKMFIKVKKEGGGGTFIKEKGIPGGAML